MEYRNELLDGWLGQAVLVMHLVGPYPDDEGFRAMSEDPTNVVNQQLQSRTGFYQFVNYDQLGVTLDAIDEDPARFFVPWGAVLQLYCEPEVTLDS